MSKIKDDRIESLKMLAELHERINAVTHWKLTRGAFFKQHFTFMPEKQIINLNNFKVVKGDSKNLTKAIDYMRENYA